LYCGFVPDRIAVLFPELLLIICCLVTLYLVGIMDDLVSVRYRHKFFVQIFCGILFVVSDLRINNLYGFLGIYELAVYVSIPITIFIVIFIINAINLIDGIDGLASGLSSIALLVFGLLFVYQKEYVYSMIAFSTLGVLVPFFYYNVFGKVEKRSKIFMGDTGSLTIGLIISVLTIRFSMYDKSIAHPMDGSIIIAFSLLIIPMFDILRVVLHRFRTGKHLFEPDMNHIHHKFLQMGFSPRKAMITILIISALFAITNILLFPYINITWLFIIDVVIWTVLHWNINQRILKLNRKKKEKA
jgi:UDP-N-acetylmuramyl pentapeptide phosphotransferase/UDP-N-acetylglucosamine-1-phosphate transferase